MNIVRFNRHELFDSEWMEYHRETLNQMEMFYIDQNKSWFNEVYNMLCGGMGWLPLHRDVRIR